MRIYGNHSKISEIYNKNKKINKTGGTSGVNGKKDEVSISNAAKDFQTVFREVNKVPNIREEKVSKIKKEIDSGNYDVSPKEIAEKMSSNLIKKKL